MASLLPKTGPLGRRLAAHLLRRASFGPTPEEINDFATKTAQQAVQDLLTFPATPPDPPIDPQTGATWVVTGRTQANSPQSDLQFILISWWLHQIMDPAKPVSAFQKMVFFLHTCINTSRKKVSFSEDMYYTLRLFMHYAPLSYRDLCYKMCMDNGMNEFLDISDSFAGNPNENYAREFIELHTIGRGPLAGPDDYTTYTEQDIREAARLITGFRKNNSWSDPLYIDPETGFPQCRLDVSRHDITDKIFSPAFQDTIITGRNTVQGMRDELTEFVDMIFAQDATARNIVRKMYRFYVKYNISAEAEQDIIVPLATTLKNNGYQLVPVLSTLLASQHFYDEDDADATDETVGSLIKSPLDLAINIARFLKVPVPDPAVDPFMTYVTFYRWGIQRNIENAFMEVFAAPETAGYPPVFQAPVYNRLWFHQMAVPPRYQMVDTHLSGAAHLLADVMAFVNNPAIIPPFNGPDAMGNAGPHAGGRVPEHLVQTLIDYLFPEPIPQARFDYFLNDVLLDNLTTVNWAMEWIQYQSSGSDAAVKPQITKLIRALLQSPEFQLA